MNTVMVTHEHLNLLRRMNIGWEGGEYGAPAVDCKRPYGNGDVEGDVAAILHWKPEGDDGEGPCWSSAQRARAAALHRQMQIVLQIVVVRASEGVRPGLYEQAKEYDYRSWRPVRSAKEAQ